MVSSGLLLLLLFFGRLICLETRKTLFPQQVSLWKLKPENSQPIPPSGLQLIAAVEKYQELYGDVSSIPVDYVIPSSNDWPQKVTVVVHFFPREKFLPLYLQPSF
jgi:hypothetical protein